MLAVFVATLALLAAASAKKALPWSSPAHYPGKPAFGYNASWQSYFEVTDPLPNISFPLSRSWAGSISTQTPGFANNSAFFWGWEKTNGSMTTHGTEPWGIWLAGGPGYSSIAAMLLENGPLGATKDSLVSNNYSWHQLADWFWVDAPVGVGYSTVAQGGYAPDEDRLAEDFWGFISNLVHVFPHLSKRPMLIAGESYAGRFIPYIMKAYFSMNATARPVTLSKVACSNPALQTTDTFENVPITRVVETYPQLIGYNTGVYDYIREQSHLCKLDLNLTYPQVGGKFRSVHIKYGEIHHRLGSGQSLAARPPQSISEDLLKKRMHPAVAQIDRAGLPPFNSTLTGKINPFFGCDVRDLVLTYAFNYSLPWTVLAPEFDYLDIPYTINPLKLLLHPHHWMNHNTTRAALHAPHNEIWQVTTLTYPWGSKEGHEDPSPAPMDFMDELAANASANGVGIVWYSGNDDALTTHFSTEVAIQNTTFGGIQGFTVPPNTSWFDDSGAFAGTVRQERNWTLGILYGAGHQTPVINPARTYAFIRDFFVGNSTVGLVETDASGAKTIHTASTPASAAIPTMLPDGVLPGQTDIYWKNNEKTTAWPSATIVAWSSHISHVMATPTGKAVHA